MILSDCAADADQLQPAFFGGEPRCYTGQGFDRFQWFVIENYWGLIENEKGSRAIWC
jgi:hypothetical protein